MISYCRLSTPKQSYASGQTVYTYGNANLVKNTKWSTDHPKHCTIKQLSTETNHEVLNTSTKYMNDTLLEKTLIAGDHLFDISCQIRQKLLNDGQVLPQPSSMPNTDSEGTILHDGVVNPDVAGSNVIRCFGRISCDSETNIDPNSTLLISTNELQLRSVHLNFEKMNSVALFAGQTVCVQGINPRGDTLYVEEIYSERQLNKVDPPNVTESLKFLIATGPYTLKDNLSYEPLHEILNYCKTNRPDVLVMLGPFVEASHQLLVDGVLDETFENFFEKIVLLVMDCVG